MECQIEISRSISRGGWKLTGVPINQTTQQFHLSIIPIKTNGHDKSSDATTLSCSRNLKLSDRIDRIFVNQISTRDSAIFLLASRRGGGTIRNKQKRTERIYRGSAYSSERVKQRSQGKEKGSREKEAAWESTGIRFAKSFAKLSSGHRHFVGSLFLSRPRCDLTKSRIRRSCRIYC